MIRLECLDASLKHLLIPPIVNFSRLSPVCPSRIMQGKNPPKFHMSQAASWKSFDYDRRGFLEVFQGQNCYLGFQIGLMVYFLFHLSMMSVRQDFCSEISPLKILPASTLIKN